MTKTEAYSQNAQSFDTLMLVTLFQLALQQIEARTGLTPVSLQKLSWLPRQPREGMHTLYMTGNQITAAKVDS